jgi:ABC-type tungstate transport system substrate-binding protein
MTTKDRIIAEKDGSLTINANAGEVTLVNRDLTDNEILETVKDHFIGAIKLGIVLTNDNVLSFARAILKKVQEK